MGFPAQVLRVLIASPSDVTQERELAVLTMQEWNDRNSAERQVVVLPLRWETHSAPEYGKRPQEIINRQVVDECDLLVGILWTRIGTPTGVAESGTLEEIERVANSGKPVMLYFSAAKQDPDAIDLDQLARLREFKRKTFPKALTETYADLSEFRDKFARQLDIQIRTLLSEGAEKQPPTASPGTDIVVRLADPPTGSDIGRSVTIETTHLNIVGFESIEDYSVPRKPAETTEPSPAYSLVDYLGSTANRDYYRQLVTKFVLQSFFKPLRFWLKNHGGVGARDVYIELNITATAGRLVVVSPSEIPTGEPSRTGTPVFLGGALPRDPAALIGKASGSWTTSLEIRALQPQREVSPPISLMIGATESCDALVTARIYADTLPEPSVQQLEVKLQVKVQDVQANLALEVLLGNSPEAAKAT